MPIKNIGTFFQKYAVGFHCLYDRTSFSVGYRTGFRGREKGSKVLLTIHFVKAEFMLAFLRNHNDSQSLIDIFERLYLELRPDRFMEIFKVCLVDNGSEFSNPRAIEFDRQGNPRTRIFYCNPSAPYQKVLQSETTSLSGCFFQKALISALLHRKISVLWWTTLIPTAGKVLGTNVPFLNT